MILLPGITLGNFPNSQMTDSEVLLKCNKNQVLTLILASWLALPSVFSCAQVQVQPPWVVHIRGEVWEEGAQSQLFT